MKKIFNLLILVFTLSFVYGCNGYKPIFTSNLNYVINEYEINGDKKLGNKIYSKLYKLSNQSKTKSDIQNLNFIIEVKKENNPTVKNSAGKILEYKVVLNTKIILNDSTNNYEVLNKKFTFSSSYKAQDQYFQTKRLENDTINNLLDITFDDIIIKMSENILKK